METQDMGVQKQKLVSMSEFECGSCKGKVVVRIPQVDVINRLTFSQVIFAHERPAKCPKCSALYLPLIGGVTEKMELKLVWKLVPTADSKEQVSLNTQEVKTERKM